ncbi:unnamed protein product [Nezara viridula]|uniref:Uncharacterized protein n=1 Tax=Nezara viridula TaxID=85310 RepID=A0A9P0MVZ2_NEZVI|nr:unnamed protein product [Nezara viridula]
MKARGGYVLMLDASPRRAEPPRWLCITTPAGSLPPVGHAKDPHRPCSSWGLCLPSPISPGPRPIPLQRTRPDQAVAAKEHCRVRLCLGLTLRKPSSQPTRLSALVRTGEDGMPQRTP